MTDLSDAALQEWPRGLLLSHVEMKGYPVIEARRSIEPELADTYLLREAIRAGAGLVTHKMTGSSSVRCGYPMRDDRHPIGWDLGTAAVEGPIDCPACIRLIRGGE